MIMCTSLNLSWFCAGECDRVYKSGLIMVFAGDRDRVYKSDLSGTSTPVDADFMLMENTRPDSSRADHSRAEQSRPEYSRSENKVDRAELIEKLERKQGEHEIEWYKNRRSK